MSQLDLNFEAAARDAAMTLVSENAGECFYGSVKGVLSRIAAIEFTAEDVRLACESEGIHPHHNNAWGAITNRLIRDGLIVFVGRYAPMRAPGSHARKTAVYRKV